MKRKDFERICDNLELMYRFCDRKYDCGRENRMCLDCGEDIQQVVDILEGMVEDD